MQNYTPALRNLMAANPHISLAYVDQGTDDHVLHVYYKPNPATTRLAVPEALARLRCTQHGTNLFTILRCRPAYPRRSDRSTACQDEPIQLGCQIQPQNGDWVGTAGSPVSWLSDTDHRRWGILSNWHVMADNQPIGARQFQPDRGNAHVAAKLDDYRAPDPDDDNIIDAAVADALVDGFHTISDKILIIGAPNPEPLAPRVGLPVEKHGRTTGLTIGLVQATDAIVRVGYDDFEARFIHQIVIKNEKDQFSAPGDSGSLVLDAAEQRPVGLLFAGGGDLTIANPIEDVISAFDLRFNL